MQFAKLKNASCKIKLYICVFLRSMEKCFKRTARFCRCSQLLQHYRSDQRCADIGYVWFLEADARFQKTTGEVDHVMISLPRRIDIGWPGWRRQRKDGTKLEWYCITKHEGCLGSFARDFCPQKQLVANVGNNMSGQQVSSF